MSAATYYTLGRTGLRVSRPVLGTMTFNAIVPLLHGKPAVEPSVAMPIRRRHGPAVGVDRGREAA
jgi:aryl-alcohol dehydrogenase-like predicted oxidoreductase